ncbi:MAG: sigma-70 family RNA polymerase sigma factor [Acidobacteriota bacterium]
MSPSPNEVSQMLLDWRNGDRDALNRLMPLVYDELRRLAHRYMNRRFAGQTLQTTALVHEAYIRLVGQDQVVWQNRSHFFAVCAQVMRNLLVDRARSRQAEKHGGGARQVSLDEADVISPEKQIDLLALDEALDKLASLDPRKSRIVEMRYFGGMSVEETAEVLDISPITVKREWLKARAWLYHQMNTSSNACESDMRIQE